MIVKITSTEPNKVLFRPLISTPEEYHVYVKDHNSGLTIHSSNMVLNPELTYYIQIGTDTSQWVKDAILEIEDNTGIKQTTTFQFTEGQNRSAIINSKKLNLSCDKKDRTYNTVSEVFFTKIYEKDYVKVEVGDVIVDVGANLGLFSLYAQSFQPKKIFAFEPIKSTFDYLTHNLQDYSNTILINKAIGSINGESLINIGKSSGSSTLVGNKNVGSGNSIGTETVVTTTFNDFISKYDVSHIDFLKVDCEGGELDLFTTIDKEFLKNNVKKIALEYHTSYIKEVVLDILKSNLFEIEQKTGNEIGMIYAYNPQFFK